jgi:predicted short-subunit dehydrogenase-like oxidoreductase (DUF2520 family)
MRMPSIWQIVSDLGGKPFTIISEKKALYHAAAVLSCGHIVALIDASIDLISKCGPNKGFAKDIILALVRSTLNNLESQNNSDALTGTFARADVATFERHLSALREYATKDVTEAYLILGEMSLDLALEQGADREAVNTIRHRISMERSAIEC